VIEADRLPRWPRECVALVASGLSAKAVDLSVLRDRIRVVAVNTSYELVPWADMLYACDYRWWYTQQGAKNFRGVKVTQDTIAKEAYRELVLVEVTTSGDELITGKLGSLGAGGNSAFQAMNLLVQIGVRGIALIGCDLTGEHWHGRHPVPLENPDESNFIRWRKAFNGATVKLAEMDVDVVNCSEASTIKAYPKMSLEQALERWGL